MVKSIGNGFQNPRCLVNDFWTDAVAGQEDNVGFQGKNSLLHKRNGLIWQGAVIGVLFRCLCCKLYPLYRRGFTCRDRQEKGRPRFRTLLG